jgi:hypothetical protein
MPILSGCCREWLSQEAGHLLVSRRSYRRGTLDVPYYGG